IELDRVVLIADVSALKHARRIPEVEFPGLPGQQALLDLLGEFVGISSSTKGFAGEDAGSFVVAVAVARRAAEAAGQDVRTKSADGTDDVCQGNVMPVPLVESLFRGLGKTEVDYTAEALLHSVILVRLQQLQGAQDAQLIRALSAELVLAALAACDREQ